MKTIYFADLTHTAQGVHSKTFPLGAGLLAVHAKTVFKNIFDCDLFKMPEDLERAVTAKCPDILCLSNYAWNMRLTMAFAEMIKQINPEVIVVMGGPNFPLEENERRVFLDEYKSVDFYVFGEGESALVNLLGNIIDCEYDVCQVKETRKKMINCSYLTNDRSQIISGEWTRTVELDQYPCPYVDGLMDKFFELPLMPLYETTRGCPFACTFCTDGISEKSKVFRKSHEHIRKSLSYIASHAKNSNSLIIADLNFGMYNDDIKTAEIITQQRNQTGFPAIVETALGKSRPDNIMKVVKILDGSLHIGLSFQSTDPEVLKYIQRKNVSTPKLIQAAEDVGLRDNVDFTEVILALPGDSLVKHYNTLREGVDLGMTNIRMYQLMLLIGSEMHGAESRKRFGLQAKWRVMPNCAGVYHFFGREVRVAEIEEIVIANNTMTFDDYVDCRVMDFIVEVFVNNDWYVELFEVIKSCGFKIFDFLVFVKRNIRLSSPKMAEIYDSFIKDTCADLFSERKDIEEYILGANVLEKHVSGELGNNELLDHKALCYLNFNETTRCVFAMASDFLQSHACADDAVRLYLTELEKFTLCRKGNVFDVEQHKVGQFNFDFGFISHANFRIDIHSLKARSHKYKFFHDSKQSSLIKKGVQMYGDSVSGLGRFIQRHKMSKMFRHFEGCQ